MVEEDKYNLTMKTCTDCSKEKPFEDYYSRPDVKSGDGLQSYCKLCCKARKHKWYKSRRFDHDVRFKNLKSGAKQRSLLFTLTVETYSTIVSKPCHYCEESIAEHAGSGIDRKDNDIGYTVENSVACCSDCNAGKGEIYSYEEWKTMIAALKEYRKKNGRGQRTRAAGPVKARSV